jgi:hypothetical protein
MMPIAHPKFRLSLVAVIAAAGLPGVARADVIFSDLPPGNEYTQDGYTVEGADAPEWGFYHQQGQTVSPGMQITVGPSDYTLTSLQLGLTWEDQSYLTGGGTGPGSNAATVSLYATGGDTPISQAEGALLGQWNLSDLPAAGHMANSVTPLTEIDGISGITLNANTNYIVEVSPGASDAYMVWCMDWSDLDPDYGTMGPMLENGAYIGDSDQTALELDGVALPSSGDPDPGDPGDPGGPGGPTDVPEPSTLALLGVGALAVGGRGVGASLATAARRARAWLLALAAPFRAYRA